MWMFAALNSIDPDIIALGDIDHFAPGDGLGTHAAPRGREDRCARGCGTSAAALAARDFLAGPFSCADIVMISVLRGLRHAALVSDILAAACRRDRECEARPAFQRALARARLNTSRRVA